MKTRIKLLISIILAMPLVVTGASFAYDGDSGSDSSSGTSGSSNTTVKELEPEHITPEQAQELKQRLQQRKDSLELRLTTTEQARIKSRCKASQGLLSSVSGRLKGIETSREAVYSGVTSRLTTLSDRLKGQGADITALQSETSTLNTKIDTYKTDLAAYRQAVIDLRAMDCASDPASFKASLETARTALSKVRTDVQDIRGYIKDTIKPTLQQIRNTLDGNKTDGTSGQSTTGGTQ